MKRILVRGAFNNFAVIENHTMYLEVKLESTEPYAHTIKVDVYSDKNMTRNEMELFAEGIESMMVSINAVCDKFGNLTANISDIAEMEPVWLEAYKQDEDGYVLFNQDQRLGQNQYASQYVQGTASSACLGEGLRWKDADKGDYDALKIHAEDAAEFHRRHQLYKEATSSGKENPAGFLEPEIG